MVFNGLLTCLSFSSSFSFQKRFSETSTQSSWFAGAAYGSEKRKLYDDIRLGNRPMCFLCDF